MFSLREHKDDHNNGGIAMAHWNLSEKSGGRG